MESVSLEEQKNMYKRTKKNIARNEFNILITMQIDQKYSYLYQWPQHRKIYHFNKHKETTITFK
jgi:hypothetical protein